jgi:nicotinamide-nucleotide amidase
VFPQNENITQGEIITVGNEIISGLVVDTNSGRISRRLNDMGFNIARVTAVGDDPAQIKEALKESLERVDLVIMTGGLGSTHDDITKHVLTEYFGARLMYSPEVEKMVENLFKARGRAVPQLARSQAEVPDKARLLLNKKGTAPGLLFQEKGQRVYALPGVPLEVDHLLEEWIVSDLAPQSDHQIGHRILKTTGIVESALWETVGSLEPLEKWAQVASLPSHLGVRVRLSAWGKDVQEVQGKLGKAEAWLRPKISRFVYGMDDQTLEGNLGKILKENRLTLSVAESCTGGLIGSRLTRVPGSSKYFLEGAITYSNESKQARLGVAQALIERHGAVSPEVATAMAEGMRQRAGTDFALSVTGIAGPDGGTSEKPVGLTYIAVADAEKSCCEKFQFHQDRIFNQERAAQAALNLLRLRFLEKGLI